MATHHFTITSCSWIVNSWWNPLLIIYHLDGKKSKKEKKISDINNYYHVIEYSSLSMKYCVHTKAMADRHQLLAPSEISLISSCVNILSYLGHLGSISICIKSWDAWISS